MNQQRRLSRHNSKQSSIGETASVGSTKSGKSNGSSDYGQIGGNTKKSSNGLGKQGSQDSGQDSTTSSNANPQSASILNVAEMLLHGVADSEILEIWLKSIQCEEFVAKFIDAGYDMPTLSRITPQDLTAIGVTEPTKRLKILSEIKKLNLQDGIPSFRPASLNHCLSLIRLDSCYYKALCEQKVDTLEKLCQLTWEDFEELGISKLGHQKRIQLTIERIKELDANEKCATKPLQEPIYDTNISQILLAASSTENHSSNAPIINKQSSVGELSSTGSGSMLSVYSAASANYHQGLSPQPLHHQQQSMIVGQLPNDHCLPQQPIYSQPPPQMIYQQPSQLANTNQLVHQPPPPPQMIYQQPSQLANTNQLVHQPPPPPPPPTNQQLHYQPIYQQHPQIANQPNLNQFMNAPVISDSLNGPGNGLNHQQNRQSMSQLPFSALANLPKHQQQLLQQSSIYATLGRQPAKTKQAPPPVPIRTNSLKSNSLTDEASDKQQQPSISGHNNSTSSLYRSGTIISYRGQYNSQTMLTKNKSFSGNAHMEVSRARFLHRNSQQQQQQQQHHHPQLAQYAHLPQQIQSIMNHNANSDTLINNMNQKNSIYGVYQNGSTFSGHQATAKDSMTEMIARQQTPVSGICNSTMINNTLNHPLSNQQIPSNSQAQHKLPTGRVLFTDDFDPLSDTTSTKSLLIQSSGSSCSMINSTSDNPTSQSSSSHDSGSSQTLYNSASSGSQDQSLNQVYQPLSQASVGVSTASSCTLNDLKLTSDRNQKPPPLPSFGVPSKAPQQPGQFNATTGKDDDFPPPPSPLSLTDSDEHDLVSINSESNFTDISNGLMGFRVGIM